MGRFSTPVLFRRQHRLDEKVSLGLAARRLTAAQEPVELKQILIDPIEIAAAVRMAQQRENFFLLPSNVFDLTVEADDVLEN